jgi:virginiamycin B lyase
VPLLMIGTLIVVAIVAGCSASTTPSTGARTASPAPSESGTPFREELEAEVPVEGSPDWPLVSFDSVWVLAPDLPLLEGDSATPNLIRIDPATNEVAATIPLPDRLCQGFTASEDAIWACSADALVRIDPATNEITDTVPIGGGQLSYRPAVGGDALWFLGSGSFVGDTVIRLDPGERTTTSYPIEQGAVGSLVYAFDALWLTVPGEGLVLRFDPATGQTTELTRDLPNPTGIVAGADSLWVSLHGANDDAAVPGDTQLVRIDPDTGDVQAEFEIGGSPQTGVEAWADDDEVLVRSTTPWLTRIDPAANEIVEIVIGGEPVQGGLAIGFDSIWTVNLEHPNVFRLSR